MSNEQDPQSIFDERARALARPRAASGAQEGTRYALFERANVRYAIEQRYVASVERAREPTPLPGTPSYWLGLSSVHGELLALVELPALLSDEAPAAAPGDQLEERGRLVIVLGERRPEFGIVIDVLLEVAATSVDVRAPSSDAGALVAGTSHDGIRILRGDALLSDPRLFLEAATSTEAISETP